MKGVNLLEQVRRNIVIVRKGKCVNVLDSKFYVKAYVAAFATILVIVLGLLTFVFVRDLGSWFPSVSGAARAISVGFFVASMLSAITLSIFCLNVAVRRCVIGLGDVDFGCAVSPSVHDRRCDEEWRCCISHNCDTIRCSSEAE